LVDCPTVLAPRASLAFGSTCANGIGKVGSPLIIAEIAGEAMARRIQLGVEYDPRPPFDSGHPDKAPKNFYPPATTRSGQCIARESNKPLRFDDNVELWRNT